MISDGRGPRRPSRFSSLRRLAYVIVILPLFTSNVVRSFGFMIILGKFSKVKSIVLGLAIAVFFFVLFEVWFKIPLYKGWLKPLDFLGY